MGIIPWALSIPAKGNEFVMIDNDVYYYFSKPNSGAFARIVLNPSGILQAYLWNDPFDWQIYITVPVDQCDSYNLCGAYAIFNVILINLGIAYHRLYTQEESSETR